MQVTSLGFFLWVAGFVGHVALLWLLMSTQRFKQFPILTILISVNVLRTAVLYLVQQYGTKHDYFYAYWIFGVVDVPLQILLIGEATVKVFRPVGNWVTGARKALAALLSIAVISAGVLTWLSSPPTNYLRQFLVIKGNLFSSILVSELLVGLVVLAVVMDLPLRTEPAKIIEGLGFSALIGLLVQVLEAHVGLLKSGDTFVALSQVGIMAYLTCLGYWIVAFREKAVAPRELPDRMREQLLLLNNRMAAELRNLQSLGR